MKRIVIMLGIVGMICSTNAQEQLQNNETVAKTRVNALHLKQQITPPDDRMSAVKEESLEPDFVDIMMQNQKISERINHRYGLTNPEIIFESSLLTQHHMGINEEDLNKVVGKLIEKD